jgi:hypothetical protein
VGGGATGAVGGTYELVGATGAFGTGIPPAFSLLGLFLLFPFLLNFFSLSFVDFSLLFFIFNDPFLLFPFLIDFLAAGVGAKVELR